MSSSFGVPRCRPHVSMLSKLIAVQSIDTRLWLQGEMVRLVDPMIDSLFLRLLISPSARPGAQPFKQSQTNVHSTLSELCQLIEGEKETTNRLIRGQMDRLVNSLFLRLTNKALVNTEVSAFASVQASPSNHQTAQPNASIEQSSTMTNSSNEHLSTLQITSPTMILSLSQNANVLTDEFDDVKEEYDDDDDEGEYMSDCVDCEDCVKGICGLDGQNYHDADNDNAETGVDTQIGLGEDEIEDQQNASQSDLMVMSDVIDNSNQSIDKTNDLLLNNENEQQIRSVLSKSTKKATNKNRENGQSDLPVIGHHHQSTPSTRGLQSSARKRSLKKVFGDAQLDVNVLKSRKRKSRQPIKRVKNGKRKPFLDDDDQEEHGNNAIGEEIATTKPNLAQQNRHFKCSYCHKSFNHKQNFQRHVRVHTGERPFQCDQCDKQFSVENNLTRHLLIHQNIKRFQCEQCEKRFSEKCNLIRHQLIHQNMKCFHCLECDKQFTQKDLLDSHLRTHSGERPYECRHCDKSFITSDHRNSHEQAIHLHVKPYRCKQCGHTATQRSSVIRHIRVVHFGLPATIKEQRALKIIDDRDPRELVEKV